MTYLLMSRDGVVEEKTTSTSNTYDEEKHCRPGIGGILQAMYHGHRAVDRMLWYYCS